MAKKQQLEASRKLIDHSLNCARKNAFSIAFIMMTCIVVQTTGSFVGKCMSNIRVASYRTNHVNLVTRSTSYGAFISPHATTSLRSHKSSKRFDRHTLRAFTSSNSSPDISNPRDPSTYQLPTLPDVQTDLKKNQRIVAFGDVHGDVKACVEFLVTAKVMDPSSTIENPIWTGNNTICVQCGDVLDRGDHELSCLRLLTSLARQAEEAGGALYLLHGNHEALNANGLFQYAFPGGNKEIEGIFGTELDTSRGNGTQTWRLQYAGNQPSRWATFEPNGLLSRPLLSNMKVAVVVGRTVFVHAGLMAEHLKASGGVEGMNQQCRDWFLAELPSELQNDDATAFRSVEDVINNASLRAKTVSKSMPECLGGGIGAKSPVWMRDYSSPADTSPNNHHEAQTLIDECLKELSNEQNFSVERMVMGHTPQKQINAALNGKAWRIDIGASSGVLASGGREVLQIIHQGAENGIDDKIDILTSDGKVFPSSERQVFNRDSIFFS